MTFFLQNAPRSFSLSFKVFNFAANNPLLLLRSRFCFYSCIFLHLFLVYAFPFCRLLPQIDCLLGPHYLLLILLLLLNYLALNSGCFHADIHSKRAIHNHNNQGSLGDTLLVLRSQAHSLETWLILICTVFCCGPILTLIPSVSIHSPSVLVPFLRPLGHQVPHIHVFSTCLNNLISHWMFISQSSFTSLFSTTSSGTYSNHFSFCHSWHDPDNFPCRTLATLSCRFIFYLLCQVTFYIHLQGDTHTLSLFTTH